MKPLRFGPIASVLEDSRKTVSRSSIVAFPATIAAMLWALTLGAVGDIDATPDRTIFIAFFTLYVATACLVIYVTAFAAAQRNDAASSNAGWQIVRRRAVPAFLTILTLGLIGAAAAYALRSFLVAWFVCGFFFMYALPMVVAGERNWLGSLYESARLALRRLGTTLIAAILIEAAVVFALALGDALSVLPYIGTFLESLLLQFAFACCAVFTLNQFIAAPNTIHEASIDSIEVHYPQAS